MRRFLILVASQIVLWVLLAELNHALSAWSLYIYAGALFILHPALLQSRRGGLAVALCGGLILDAGAPAALLGTHVILLPIVQTIVHQLRDRVRHDDTAARIVVALLLNFGLFLALTIRQWGVLPASSVVWSRLFVDLLGSQIFLALITPWFLALQSRMLVLARAGRGVLA